MDSFEKIYSAYAKDVYRFALSLCSNPTVAEDITQETFYKALRGASRFRGDCEVRTWLLQIAKNEWLMYCRKQKRLVCLEERPEDTSEDSPEDEVSRRELLARVRQRLGELPEPYHSVFLLRHFGELPFSQIGQLRGKTENWARVTYYRAKEKLREGSE